MCVFLCVCVNRFFMIFISTLLTSQSPANIFSLYTVLIIQNMTRKPRHHPLYAILQFSRTDENVICVANTSNMVFDFSSNYEGENNNN